MSDNEQKYKNFNTVADIVAMVRWAAQSYDGEAEKSEGLLRESFELSASNYRTIANLVEAAWKRESKAIATEHAVLPAVLIMKPSGNAAAMREALQKIREKCVIYNNDLAEEIDALCGNALSAPARNCDMYLTQPEMSMAYEAYRKAAMKRYGNGLTGRVPTVKQKPMTYDEWLIAPAAERKGENDGR